MKMEGLAKIIRVWPLIVRRLIVNWRTLSTVIIGVVLACSIMSGTVVFFDSLKEIALDDVLKSLDKEEINILVQAEKGPTNADEASTLNERIHSFSEGLLSSHVSEILHGGRTTTLFFSYPGQEQNAGKDNSRTFFAYLPNLQPHITITDGIFGGNGLGELTSEEISVIKVLVNVQDAANFGLQVGDRISAVPYWDDSVSHVTAEVAGTFEKNNQDDLYWSIEQKGFMYSASDSFKTIPLYLNEDVYMEHLASKFLDLETTYVWMFDIDRESINSSNASNLASNITYFGNRLESELNRFVIRTELDKSLQKYDTRILFTKLQMYVVLIMITFVVLYYVVALSSLVVEERRFEVSKLRSRGASSSQILSVFVIEGATISFFATLLGPLIAVGGISLLGFLPGFHEINDGAFLSA
ncbi:MAG TPA: hypothetical protein DCS57_03405, partial [Dehalococcoidia bacterium]|nr:hypothetical protein [Dehalococcoidia bacterium]